MPQQHIAVTGAFGYSGQSIARELLAAGHTVSTLTNTHPDRDPFMGRVRAYPLAFDDPGALRAALAGVDVLINTYWVRFNHANFTHEAAVHNSLTLFHAAQAAGVRRIVHVSITNPALESPLEYFSGKARVEQGLIATGLPYTILRPAVLFGGGDILINNIAWALRHLPVMGVFGDGAYRIQPIHVVDFARLAVAQSQATGSTIINAIGPETFTYRELVETIGQLIGQPRPVISVPPGVGYAVGAVIGWLQGDVLLTRAEIAGLMAGLLAVDAPPTGTTHLTDWVRDHAATLGQHYASELARR